MMKYISILNAYFRGRILFYVPSLNRFRFKLSEKKCQKAFRTHEVIRVNKYLTCVYSILGFQPFRFIVKKVIAIYYRRKYV